MRDRTTIRAELSGSDTCTALGMTVKSESPVIALCRKLIDAGRDPATPLEAYRGNTLGLRLRSIGQAAAFRVNTDTTGRPAFTRQRTSAAASPIEFRDEAAE